MGFKRSIPFAQGLLLCHLYSTNNESQDSCDKLGIKLIERRHKQQEINKAIKRTKTLERKNLLEEKAKKQSNRMRYFFQNYAGICLKRPSVVGAIC